MRNADLKATALLKLVYLEMFGHDMSWASFHVLEVMSSTKYLQKRVGYLSAVQSFRPDTEVLMLATNLLKKVCFWEDFLLWRRRSDAKNRIGLDFDNPHHDVTPYSNTSTCYNRFPSPFGTLRSIATIKSL